MPPLQRGSARKLASGRYQLRYYDETGKRRTGGCCTKPRSRVSLACAAA
jgi:hypothetical protein